MPSYVHTLKGPRIVYPFQWAHSGTFLVVQWLGLCTSTAEGTDSIPGQGTKISQDPHAVRPKKPNKQKTPKQIDKNLFKKIKIKG